MHHEFLTSSHSPPTLIPYTPSCLFTAPAPPYSYALSLHDALPIFGSALVRFALDDVRRRGLMARPTCWFVRGWIQRHRVYADLLAEPSRERTQADPDDERNETL